MKKISNTPFTLLLKVLVPIAVLGVVLYLTIANPFHGDYKERGQAIFLTSAAVFYGLFWIALFSRYQTVFLDADHLQTKTRKINFTEIIRISTGPYHYTVTYLDNGEKRTLVYLPQDLLYLFRDPDYVKKIRKLSQSRQQ